ncbi:DUF58 domain-containing protein [Motilimonas sp. KMU-193]|uniref:DUF58 domain-containing protein n=1 Tax=Motilimonas sp. KMU-193 TaxID=3388668 RepID=UPI00396B20AC
MQVHQWVSSRFDKWLKKNVPSSSRIVLSRKNLFILPTWFGVIYLVTCFTLFLLGTNYQNNLILFLSFLLSSVFVSCLLLSHKNMSGLVLDAADPEPQFSEQVMAFPVKISHRSEQGQFYFSFQKQVHVLDAVIKSQQVVVYAQTSQRGYFEPGRLTVYSLFPLGLFRVWSHVDLGWQGLVYPKPIDAKLLLDSDAGDQQADLGRSRTKPGFDEFAGLKTYQVGESLKSVAWKQLAQGRGWHSKAFEQAQGAPVWLTLNEQTGRDLETKLGQLTSQVLQLDEQNALYGLRLAGQEIVPAQGPSHKLQCLAALATFGLSTRTTIGAN